MEHNVGGTGPVTPRQYRDSSPDSSLKKTFVMRDLGPVEERYIQALNPPKNIAYTPRQRKHYRTARKEANA